MKRPDEVATAMHTGQTDVIEDYIAEVEAKLESYQNDCRLVCGHIAHLEAEVERLTGALEDLQFIFAAVLKTCGGGVLIQPRILRELPRDAGFYRHDYLDGSVLYTLSPSPVEEEPSHD